MQNPVQVDPSHYDFSNYVSFRRFASYYYQIKGVMEYKPTKILEIGPGDLFLSNTLRDKGFTLDTMDFDPNLNPDIVGDITSMPCKDEAYDLITCFEVLEHLPFEKFETALSEMHRVSSENVYISIPYANYEFKFELRIPPFKGHRIFFTIPHFWKKHQFDGQHYWEAGKSGYGIKLIRESIKKHFTIESMNNYADNPYHLFFKLKKK